MEWFDGNQRYAKIACSSSGANAIVAAVAGKRIVVLKWVLSASAAVNAKWQSHTTPTDLTGLFYLDDLGGVADSFSPLGLFETINGEGLDLNLSGAVPVGGNLVYILA